MRQDHLELHLVHERTNWWFVARERILCDIIERHVLPASGKDRTDGADRRPVRFVDLGCGGAGFVEALNRYGDAVGVDASPEAVRHGQARGLDVRQGSLPSAIPLEDASVDVVTLLDVLEHIEDDDAALLEVRRLLRPGGALVITVPAYQFLWSYHDTVNGHRRRYTQTLLRRRLEAAGLTVERSSYFNTFLFPPIAAVRSLRKLIGERERADSPVVPGPVNAMLTAVFGAEKWLLRWLAFPFGVSIVAVATKPPSTGSETRFTQAREGVHA